MTVIIVLLPMAFPLIVTQWDAELSLTVPCGKVQLTSQSQLYSIIFIWYSCIIISIVLIPEILFQQ